MFKTLIIRPSFSCQNSPISATTTSSSTSNRICRSKHQMRNKMITFSCASAKMIYLIFVIFSLKQLKISKQEPWWEGRGSWRRRIRAWAEILAIRAWVQSLWSRQTKMSSTTIHYSLTKRSQRPKTRLKTFKSTWSTPSQKLMAISLTVMRQKSRSNNNLAWLQPLKSFAERYKRRKRRSNNESYI